MRRNSTGWLTIRRRAVTATTAVAAPATDSRLTRLAAGGFAKGIDPYNDILKRREPCSG